MSNVRRLGLLAPLAAVSLAGCGINSVPTSEEKVNAAWGNLQADYQRRADLIPNLVETVKGYAAQEKSVLIQVTEARAKAGSVQLSAADLEDPAKVQEFANAQARLSAATRRGRIITRRCASITRASAPSLTRSAPRSSTAPSRRFRSRRPRPPRTRRP